MGSVVVSPTLGGSAAVSCTQRHAAFRFRLRAATSETRNRLGRRSSPRHQAGGLAFAARNRLSLRWRYLNSTDEAPGIGVAAHSNGRRSTCRCGTALGAKRRAESRAADGSQRQAARLVPRKCEPSATVVLTADYRRVQFPECYSLAATFLSFPRLQLAFPARETSAIGQVWGSLQVSFSWRDAVVELQVDHDGERLPRRGGKRWQPPDRLPGR